MATYTVMKRKQLFRAELEAETVKQLSLCGYQACGEFDATDADDAIAQYKASPAGQAKEPPLIAPRARKILWFGGICAVLWFVFLIFGLLPLAFQD